MRSQFVNRESCSITHQFNSMVRNDVVTEFYALTRQFLGKKWCERYPEGNLTATGLKNVLRRHIECGDEPECAFIRKFVGVSNLNEVTDLLLVNRSKCVENFHKGRTRVLQPHTLEFIVQFFNLELRSIDQYTLAKGNGHLAADAHVLLPAINIDPADLQGFLRVCALICNAVQKPRAL